MSKAERRTKQAPKNQVKLNVSLNDEQKQAVTDIWNNKFIFLNGEAGSGKTLTGIYAAFQSFFKNEVNKIIISRPYVMAKEELGFLPGDLKEKMDPMMVPIYDNIEKVYGKREQIDKYIMEGELEIAPVAMLRGRTFDYSFVVMDECQNLTEEQLIMTMTRLGKGSKLILTGDIKQCDLRNPKYSAINLLIQLCERNRVNGLVRVDLEENHRDPIVAELLMEIEDLKAGR